MLKKINLFCCLLTLILILNLSLSNAAYAHDKIVKPVGLQKETLQVKNNQRFLTSYHNLHWQTDFGRNCFLAGSLERKVYDTLRSEISKVASGQKRATNFVVDVTGSNVTYDPATKRINGFNHQKMINLLLGDCPYELYWYDKTQGCQMTFNYTSDYQVTTMKFNFRVSNDYRQDYHNSFLVNQDKIAQAKLASANAQAIVTVNANKTDYEKLLAYKNEICRLVDYDYNATSSTTGYGEPWQLVNVFDNDSTTNVVCEGYAKAFQYLCDLSNFKDSSFACYSVTGTLHDGGKQTNHMWNIVRLKNKNYLVDITNCDLGSTGEVDELFMAGDTSHGSVSQGYWLSIENQPGLKIGYTYSSDVKDIYGQDVLKLASSRYFDSSLVPFTIAIQLENIDAHDTLHPTPFLKAKITKNIALPGKIKYQWYRGNNTQIEGATHSTYDFKNEIAGKHIFYCQIAIGNYIQVSNKITVILDENQVANSASTNPVLDENTQLQFETALAQAKVQLSSVPQIKTIVAESEAFLDKITHWHTNEGTLFTSVELRIVVFLVSTLVSLLGLGIVLKQRKTSQDKISQK